MISVSYQMLLGRIMRWMKYVARMRDTKVHTGFWWGRPEEKRSLGRPRCRWEHNIKIDLQEEGWEEWTGLIWLRIGTGDGCL